MLTKLKLIGGAALALGLLIVVFTTMGVNDAGFRTVIQSPSGAMSVKFDPGWYFSPMAKTTVYPDFLTYDFSSEDGHCNFVNPDGSVDGIKVRYQDGGEGAVCGLVRVALPSSEVQMLEFHKAYRDEEGVRSKLLNQSIPKSINLTASLMSSEEAYATKRSEFLQMGEDQAKRGVYRTKLVEKMVAVGLDENGKEEFQKKLVPEPVIGSDGNYVTNGSDFEKYGVHIQQFDIKAWDFEPKTLEQISNKRAAEMAIVTAKANADRAYYENITVEAEGKKKVTEAEFAQLEKAKREIVNQQKEQDMAVIKARQAVLVQEQAVLRAAQEVKEQQQLALAAIEEAKKIKTLADGEAYAKKAIIQADNALAAKLQAEIEIQKNWAQAYKERQVPATVTVLGGGSGGTTVAGDSEVSDFLKILTAEAAKNLNYDRKVDPSRK